LTALMERTQGLVACLEATLAGIQADPESVKRKVERYRQIIRDTLLPLIEWKYPGDKVRNEAVFDEANDRCIVSAVGGTRGCCDFPEQCTGLGIAPDAAASGDLSGPVPADVTPLRRPYLFRSMASARSQARSRARRIFSGSSSPSWQENNRWRPRTAMDHRSRMAFRR
jgi:hypothetical protein